MWTESELQQMENKGIRPAQVESQLETFKQGFPYLPIITSASVERGIRHLPEAAQLVFLEQWEEYLKTDKCIVKFVPASGAASRMFKDLFAFLEASYQTPVTAFEQAFFDGIHRFAFYKALNEFCLFNENKSIDELIKDGQHKSVVDNLLNEKGLNYGQLPKGLIYFHSYPEAARTAMEEHWVEGAFYARNKTGRVNIHFTVSGEHRKLFESLTDEKLSEYASRFAVDYQISFSEQKPSTDTIAAGADNSPFRENDRLLFRPGGHGALIENLNDLDADVVFIKNIDNVVPDHFKGITTRYKQLIGGILIAYQKRIFSYLKQIDSGKYTHEDLLEMLTFLQKELCIEFPESKLPDDDRLVSFIQSKLNRPIRVCGMVRNQGEPGGGPFIAVNADGTSSLQILESSQIDLKDPAMKTLFEQGTHFNPVDLVCSLRDYKDNRYHLPDYVDKNTGFISIKSKSGKELKALELPGLWNGAMSDWNTVFVEVPVETFNPVKVVNDLLRPEHQ